MRDFLYYSFLDIISETAKRFQLDHTKYLDWQLLSLYELKIIAFRPLLNIKSKRRLPECLIKSSDFA